MEGKGGERVEGRTGEGNEEAHEEHCAWEAAQNETGRRDGKGPLSRIS